jgi:hypothetical protein
MSRQYHYRWQWRLRSSADALWPLVADTNRFNMAVGLPALDPEADTGTLLNARRHLRFSKLGVTVEWIEKPFEWVEPHSFGVVHQYSRGPIEEMRVRARLDPLDDGGTNLTYEVWATPRNVIGLLAIPFQIGMLSARSFSAVFRRYDDQASAVSSTAGLSSRVGRIKFIPGGERRLEAAADELLAQGVPAQIATTIADLVRRADDMTVSQLRPYELADIWGLPRRSVLEACLVATRLGCSNSSGISCARCVAAPRPGRPLWLASNHRCTAKPAILILRSTSTAPWKLPFTRIRRSSTSSSANSASPVLG